MQLGNLSIGWNPAAGSPHVHAITIYRGGEIIDVLRSASFEILREDQLEAAHLTGILTAVLRVADLRVSDELEVAMTVRTSDPTLGDENAGLLLFSPNPAPGRYTLDLSWDEGQKPEVRMTPGMAAAAKQEGRSLRLAFDNPPAFPPPKDAPPRYQWQRVVQYSDFPDWPAVSRRFAPLFNKAATLANASPVKAEARRIAAANTTAMDRAIAALDLVQKDVRYIYVGLNGANLTPASADETWQRRYGDCKGKVALLLALLKEMGIEAQPVLANNSGTDDGLDERLPNPGVFDHVLVRATIGGKPFWLDGTLPPVVPPTATPTLPYRWVLPLASKGQALEHVDWRPAAQPDELHLTEIDARAGFDQPAKVVNETILRGIKGLQQEVQLSSLAQDQLLTAFRQELVGSTWRTIDSVKWRYDRPQQASVLTISGTWTVDWDKDGDGDRSLALPGGGFSPPERRARPDDQDRTAPYYNSPSFSCHVTVVRPPSTTSPAQWSFKPGYDTHMFGANYYRAFELRGGIIRMIRGYRTEQPEISAATASRDNERVATFDNSMGYISYRSSEHAPPRSDPHIPGIDEVDWTKDSRACLATSAVR